MYVQQGKIRRIHLARQGVSGCDPYALMEERKLRRIHLARNGVSGLGATAQDLALEQHLRNVLELQRLAMLQQVAPVEAALAKAVPIIAFAGQQVEQGYVADVAKLRAAKNDLERILGGDPTPFKGFPQGFPGFTALGLMILGAKIPADVANATTPAAQLYNATRLKLSRPISQAMEILADPRIHGTVGGEYGEAWTVFINTLADRTEKAAAATADAAEAAVDAAKKGVKGAGDLAKALNNGAKALKKWSKQFPLVGVAALGLAILAGFGLLALALTSRRK